MRKLVIREVEAVKATAVAMYGCEPVPWCPPCDPTGSIGR